MHRCLASKLDTRPWYESVYRNKCPTTNHCIFITIYIIAPTIFIKQLQLWSFKKRASLQSNGFSCIKFAVHKFYFQRNLDPKFQIKTGQHWFRSRLGAEQEISHCLTQQWQSWLTHAVLGRDKMTYWDRNKMANVLQTIISNTAFAAINGSTNVSWWGLVLHQWTVSSLTHDTN